MKFTEILSAGIIGFLITVIGHPLWISLNAEWVIWGIGIGLLSGSGALNYFKRYSFLQALFGIWGLLWIALFFFEVFPAFSISLI